MPKVAKPNPENLAPDGLPYHGYVRLPQIMALLPVSRSTFLAWVQNGKFPKPHKIGPRASAWRVEDVRALLACPVVTEPDPNTVKAVAAAKAKRAVEAEKAARRALLL